MMTFVLNSLARLHKDEAGQGLVEYLLILALVAFAATAGMGSLAKGLNSAFSQIGIILGQYITEDCCALVICAGLTNKGQCSRPSSKFRLP